MLTLLVRHNANGKPKESQVEVIFDFLKVNVKFENVLRKVPIVGLKFFNATARVSRVSNVRVVCSFVENRICCFDRMELINCKKASTKTKELMDRLMLVTSM